MAFFQNTMPSAVAGISLPTDGSDAVTVHLVKQGVDGDERTSYEGDKHRLEQLEGAKTALTTGGCMITFEQADAINAMFVHASDLFDAAMVEVVKDRRKNAFADVFRRNMNKEQIFFHALGIVKRFRDSRPANTSNPFGGASVVNIRTHLSTLT